MSNTLVLATYSKARRYLDKALSVIEQINEAANAMSDNHAYDIPDIRAIVDDLNPILHDHIPVLLAILRKRSLPPIRTDTGHGRFPVYMVSAPHSLLHPL